MTERMTEQADLVIQNARVLLESGIVHAGVAIKNGKITAIATEEHLPPSEQIIDAKRMILVPGLIDGHAHIHDDGMLEHEDFRTGTQAAAAGGVTTVVDMPLVSQTDSPEVIREKIKSGEEMSYVDFTLYGGMMNEDNIFRIKQLIELGVAGFKAFTCEPFKANAGIITRSLSEVSEYGGHLTIHSEDQGILDEFAKDMENDWDAPISHSLSRPILAEVLAVKQNIAIAQNTGGHLHIAHITTGQGVLEIERGKQSGILVTTEVCPHHLMFHRDQMNTFGPRSKLNPPLRTMEDRAALWSALLRGTIDMVVSDHAPCPIEKKEIGKEDIREAWSGVDGVQTILRILLSEGINRGRLSFHRLLRILSRNPARIFGLYPKKGVIQVGSDADLVLIDHTREQKITTEMMFSKCNWSIYEGMTLKGVPEITLVRGEVVFRDGDIIGESGHGKFQPMGGTREIQEE